MKGRPWLTGLALSRWALGITRMVDVLQPWPRIVVVEEAGCEHEQP